jgi:ABC-type transporter lipoprotein component MlaA
MVIDLIKKYASSAFSGYTSIILAVLVSALLTYLTTLNITINSQKETITELSTDIGSLKEKLISQAASNNYETEREIIIKNNLILKEENERLIEQNKELKQLTKEKEKDMEQINS